MLHIDDNLKKYYTAWWNRAPTDKPLLWIQAPKENRNPVSVHGSAESWLDADAVVSFEEARLENTFYGGVAYPILIPDIGPDSFSGILGAQLTFAPFGETQTKSWADTNAPVLEDYAAVSRLSVAQENRYFTALQAIMKTALKRSQGKYFVGIPDIHGDIDALAVLRGGPEKICLDLMDNPEGVTMAMQKLWIAWQTVYNTYADILASGQEGTASWTGPWSPGRMYNVQSDFICLISPQMFQDYFLENIVREIDFLDHSIFHLDGPDALRHIDLLLDIGRLNAIQWVPGAGKTAVAQWIPLLKQIQLKHKSVIVYCTPVEIPLLLDNLTRDGLMLFVACDNERDAIDVAKLYGW